jgi:DNA primase
MIDQATVDRIMEAAQGQITDVISEFVHLKKRGINYIGNCPFHNEKTPSFIVSPHKGIFKCFGCGKGGNAVNFLMEHEQVSFVDAIRTLGRKFHIHIEEKEPTAEDLAHQNERESMMVVSEFANRFFVRSLFETDEGQSVGLGYFRQRGFRDDIIKKFQLGYSPESRDALTKEAQIQGFKLEFLEKTGVSIVRDDFKGDRFRGRVIFPIHSLSGKVIAFGGRILKADVKTAKYLNSPESEIYHKSKILYGIYQARQEMVRQDRTYLVEGYTDVLSFHQAGVTNVVASSGTALTVDQIRLMARFSPNITIIYDGDTAGIKASMRGIDLVLEEGMNVKVLLLPDGEDPDSYAKKLGGEKLKEYIKSNETDFIKFKTSLLLEESKNDPIMRAQLIQDIVRTISVIPDPIVRSVYVRECSTLMKVEEPVLYLEIGKIKKKKQEIENNRSFVRKQENLASSVVPTAPLPLISNPGNPLENEERELLRYLLKYGDYPLDIEDANGEKRLMSAGEYILQELKQDELKSLNPVHNLIITLYEENMSVPGFKAQRFFVTHPNPDISRLASDLVAREYQLSRIHKKYGGIKTDEDILDKLVSRVVIELKWRYVKLKIDQARLKIKEAQEAGDNEVLMSSLRELTMYQTVFGVISHKQGERTVI